MNDLASVFTKSDLGEYGMRVKRASEDAQQRSKSEQTQEHQRVEAESRNDEGMEVPWRDHNRLPRSALPLRGHGRQQSYPTHTTNSLLANDLPRAVSYW